MPTSSWVSAFELPDRTSPLFDESNGAVERRVIVLANCGGFLTLFVGRGRGDLLPFALCTAYVMYNARDLWESAETELPRSDWKACIKYSSVSA